MDNEVMDSLLAGMTPAELYDAHRFINACERYGSMSHAEGDAWRRQIEARRLLLEVDESATVS